MANQKVFGHFFSKNLPALHIVNTIFAAYMTGIKP